MKDFLFILAGICVLMIIIALANYILAQIISFVFGVILPIVFVLAIIIIAVSLISGLFKKKSN